MQRDIALTSISRLIAYGREEITTKKELKKFAPGSPISYKNNDNIFKRGGFLIKITKEYFIYITPDFSQKYRVRFANVQKMWVGDVYKLKKDLIYFTKTNRKKTNYPVKINGIDIYYGKNNFDRARFTNTHKYKRMMQWCDYFNQ